MTMIDIAYYFCITGLSLSGGFGILLVLKLSLKAKFKDMERYFNAEYVNSEHKNIKRIILLGNTLFIMGFVIFIAGKIMGEY